MNHHETAVDEIASTVGQVIRDRRTTKVLATQPLPCADAAIPWEELLEAAGWAPFHRPAHASHLQETELQGIVPWRFHVLPAAGCRTLRDWLAERECGKIREMLASAEALILATWLPNPSVDSAADGTSAEQRLLFEPTLENMEHIAAASAAIQNLLLMATARGLPNYWSSGGLLREADLFDRLGIPRQEILLGAIFLFPQAPTEQAQTVFSKLRDQRGPHTSWARLVQLD